MSGFTGNSNGDYITMFNQLKSMRGYNLILLLLLIISAIPSIAYAAPVVPFGNDSAISANYTITSGWDQIRIFTNVPLTTEDVAFPIKIFYFFAVFGFAALLLGIVFVANDSYVPSLAILSCGILAMACFFIAATMAPYVATSTITNDFVANTTTNTIYITEINTYVFSSWVGNAMWGGAVAGLVMTILGTLSFIGWFHRKGLKDAARGKYVETDVQDDERKPGSKY